MFAHIKELFTRPSGYKISRSVRLRSSASAYFNRTPAGSGSLTTWTWSGWIKRGKLGADQTLFAMSTGSSTTYTQIAWVGSTDALLFFDYQGGVVKGQKTTSSIYRDPSAWYHVVCVWDTTNATAADRMRLYVNGVRLTTFSASTDPSSSQSGNINTAAAHQIGAINAPSLSNYVDGYLTEVNFIDGQALTPSSFGETNAVTGVWQPKKYTGTYGTNGFYLNFSDNSAATATTIGKDYSGNGNNWTPNNISVTAGATYDSMTDVPTLTSATAANFCTINPLIYRNSIGQPTYSNANLTLTGLGSANSWYQLGTIGVSSGKWYFEETITTASNGVYVGVCQESNLQGGNFDAYYDSANGILYRGATNVGSVSTATTGDIIGIAYDADSATCAFYKNNTLLGTVTSVASGVQFPLLCVRVSAVINANFGQRPFSYTPPTGFVALNTQNLPTPTISNGANYMAATLYTGNGATQSITNTVNGVSFQPDFVWMKSRSTVINHVWYDSVRGVNKILFSSLTNAEFTDTDGLMSFNSSGYTLGAETSSNNSGTTFVGWQWKAGGTSSSNTNGSITSTVSVGSTQGFSVVTYTGTGANATVGHGLGVAPKMIIFKVRSTTNDWAVYHGALTTPATQVVFLNLTNAVATSTTAWNSTNPTSSVFSIGNSSPVNTNGGTFVAYCFAEVAGFSKFGGYTGNGSTDGTFVFLGFRPRFVMIKRTDSTSDWIMYDTSRNTYNEANLYLGANISTAESTGVPIDVLSNGFKCRNTIFNVSSGTYIYACFAENPTKFSLAR